MKRNGDSKIKAFLILPLLGLAFSPAAWSQTTWTQAPPHTSAGFMKKLRYGFENRVNLSHAAKDLNYGSPFMTPGILKFHNFLGVGHLPQAVYSYRDSNGQWHTRIVELSVDSQNKFVNTETELLNIANFALQDVGDIDGDGLYELFGQHMLPITGVDCYEKRIFEQVTSTSLPSNMIYNTPLVQRSCGIVGYIPSATYAPDMDGNGFGEILWDRRTTANKTGMTTKCTGNNTFTTGQTFVNFMSVNDFFIGDADSDGNTEYLRFNTTNQWSVFGFNAQGLPPNYAIEALTSTNFSRYKTAAVLTDLSKDNLNEVAVLGFFPSLSTAPKIYFYQAFSAGNYTQLLPQTLTLAAADGAERDTDSQRVFGAVTRNWGAGPSTTDLVVNTGANLYVTAHVGAPSSGTFLNRWDARTSSTMLSGSPVSVEGGPTAVTDLNGDGFPELWFNTSYTDNSGMGTLSMFENIF